MLEPYFHQHPPGYPTPTEEHNYRVIGYARSQEYTLVFWRIDHYHYNRSQNIVKSYYDGQSLYRGQEHLASIIGKLMLYQPRVIPPGPSRMPETRPTLEDRLDKFVGEYGIPVPIAIALNDPANTIWLEV